MLHAGSGQILWPCGFIAQFRSTGILGKKGKTWLIGLFAGAALYTLAGFLIAPRAIKSWIESTNLSGPGCRLDVQAVYVNPFTMFVSFTNATLLDQENKWRVSAAGAETKAWTIGSMRGGVPGRNVAIRNLVVTNTQTGEPFLSVPGAVARRVEIGAGGSFISAGHVRLGQPDAAITRDETGIRVGPAWLSAPGNDGVRACISLDGLEAVDGSLRLTDEAVTPTVQLELRDVQLGARRRAGVATPMADIDVEARVGADGTLGIRAQLRHPGGRHPEFVSVAARNVDLQLLSPYVRDILGRNVVAGFGDATLRHERDDATLRFENHFSVTGLRFGDAAGAAAGEAPPRELALALVTNAANRGELSVQGAISESRMQTVVGVLADSLAAHFDDLAARPFGVLAEIAGAPDAALDRIEFVPGSAGMAATGTETLTLLANALLQRPRLDLRVRPAYDLAADRNAIAAQQVGLHIALATSAGPRQGADAAGPDLGDPRVRDILDEFAGARLSAAQRRTIAGNASDETSRYRDTYLALVANERVSETVLRRLARFRARSVIDALERQGIDRIRMRIAESVDVTAKDTGTVSLELEMTARLASDGTDTRSGEPGSAVAQQLR